MLEGIVFVSRIRVIFVLVYFGLLVRFVVSFESRGQHDSRFVRVRVGVGLVASCGKIWCASCIRIGLL